MASTGSSVILASASPTRARLLKAAGVEFIVEPAAVDEAGLKRKFRAATRTAAECARALAMAKAEPVSRRHPRALVIGADQILACDGIWFDKPDNLAAARSQLVALRGRRHELTTAACVMRATEPVWQVRNGAMLEMREFSDAFLDTYLAAEGEAILGSVGAYRLEDRGIQLFERIEGDHFAILGLPIFELVGALRAFGVLPC